MKLENQDTEGYGVVRKEKTNLGQRHVYKRSLNQATFDPVEQSSHDPGTAEVPHSFKIYVNLTTFCSGNLVSHC